MDKTDEKRWTLRISYINESGKSLAPSRRKSCIEGLLYYVEPLKIPGWWPDKPFLGINLHENCEVSFIYHRTGSN